MEGEAFQNTRWVNHFETQSIEIGGLNNELYEFKTVGRNGYLDNNNVNPRSKSPPVTSRKDDLSHQQPVSIGLHSQRKMLQSATTLIETLFP